GGTSRIGGSVSVTNANGYTALTVDDTAATVGRTVSLDASDLSGLTPTRTTVPFNERELISVNRPPGRREDPRTIVDTPERQTVLMGPGVRRVTTTVSTGDGNDQITVVATTGRLTVNPSAGQNTVVIGGPLDSPGRLEQIRALATVVGQEGTDSLIL